MRALQAGDIDAFEELVHRYRARLTAFVAQRVGDRVLAEDFVQETFLRVYQEAGDYIPMGRFRGWVYTIARNLRVNSLSEARRHLGLSPDAPMVLWTWHGNEPAEEEEEPDDEERRRNIEAATRALPEKQRRVIALRYYHGLSVAEIADVEGCPVGTVKSRLHHGHEKLREKLRRVPA